MNIAEQQNLFNKIDDYLKTFGTLNIVDVKQLLSNNSEKTARAKKYLNSKNNYIDVIDNESGQSQRFWYYKKLKTCKCLFCGQDFKATNVYQRFCCNGHKKFYLNKKEHEFILPIQ